MNPIAPVSMLQGKGSGKALAVMATLIGLAVVAALAVRAAPPKASKPQG